MNKKVSILLLSLFGVAAINASIASTIPAHVFSSAENTPVAAVQPTIGSMDKASALARSTGSFVKSAAISTGSFVKNHKLITGGVAALGLSYLGYKKFVSKTAVTAPKETWRDFGKRWAKYTGIGATIAAGIYVTYRYSPIIAYAANSKIGRTVIGAAVSTGTALGFNKLVDNEAPKDAKTSTTTPVAPTAPQHSTEARSETPGVHASTLTAKQQRDLDTLRKEKAQGIISKVGSDFLAKLEAQVS